MLAGVGIASESMFGREYGCDVYACVKHNIESVAVAYKAGMVAKQSHALSFKHRGIQIGACGAYCYRVSFAASGSSATH